MAPSTAEGAFLLALLVLPGFILVGVSRVGRPPGEEEGPIVIVLRSFAIALAIQIPLFPLWTKHLAKKTSGTFEGLLATPWESALYAAVVLLGVPVVLGLLLNVRLARSEAKGELSGMDRLLGGRLTESAWDTLMRGLSPGDVLIINLADGRKVAGKWAEESWASPGEADAPGIFLARVWALDEAGSPVAELPSPPWGGVWLPKEQITSLTRFDG